MEEYYHNSIGGQNTDIMDCDEGRENLDLMVNIMEGRETEEQETLKQDVMTLGNAFIEDVQDRTQHLDMQYLTGLKRFCTVYLDTVTNTEPAISATPKLASLLHTYFSPQLSTQVHVAGTRCSQLLYLDDEMEPQREVKWHQVEDLPNALSVRWIQIFK